MTSTVSMKQALNFSNYFLSMHIPQKKECTVQIEIEEMAQSAFLSVFNVMHDAILERIYTISKKEATTILKDCLEAKRKMTLVKDSVFYTNPKLNRQYKEIATKFIQIVDTIEMIAGFDETDESSQEYIDYWAYKIQENLRKNEKRVYGKSNVLKLIG